MPRYEDRDSEEKRYDKGGYRGSDPYLSSNLYNRNGRDDVGLDGGGTRLYIGQLSSRTRSQDLEDLFNKYGRVRDVDMKHNFAFVEFLDVRDADDARYYTNGKDLDGSRLIVEFARRGPRGLGGGREYLGIGPTPGTGRCYNCGNEGHWARDCKAGDWRDKCYRCGQYGHIERNCQNSHALSNSLSRSRSHSPRGHKKTQKFVARSRSRSYSVSPGRKNDSPIKDSHKRLKSKSLSSPTKEMQRSISASPLRGVDANASQSPKALQATESVVVQESRHDLSRRTSRSPEVNMEKLSPPKDDGSPVSEEE